MSYQESFETILSYYKDTLDPTKPMIGEVLPQDFNDALRHVEGRLCSIASTSVSRVIRYDDGIYSQLHPAIDPGNPVVGHFEEFRNSLEIIGSPDEDDSVGIITLSDVGSKRGLFSPLENIDSILDVDEAVDDLPDDDRHFIDRLEFELARGSSILRIYELLAESPLCTDSEIDVIFMSKVLSMVKPHKLASRVFGTTYYLRQVGGHEYLHYFGPANVELSEAAQLQFIRLGLRRYKDPCVVIVDWGNTNKNLVVDFDPKSPVGFDNDRVAAIQ